MRYGLWATGPRDWVREEKDKVVTYPSVAAAKRDIKANYVHQNYEIKEYKR